MANEENTLHRFAEFAERHARQDRLSTALAIQWSRASKRQTPLTWGRRLEVLRADHGCEITGLDVLAACSSTLNAARNGGSVAEVEGRIRALVAGPPSTAKDLIAVALGTLSDRVMTFTSVPAKPAT